MFPTRTRPFVFSEAELDRIGSGDLVVRDGVVDVAPWLVLALGTPVSPAGIGRTGAARPEVRADRTAFVAWPEAIRWFDALGTALSTGLRVALPAMTVQLAIFAAGDGYVVHRDALAGDAFRRLTATLYLDSSWTAEDGGALRAAGRDTAPFGGRLVVFRSDVVEHEVLPPRRQRVALTAWFGSDGAIRR
jgi:SM-20-related protein